jgi:DNA repair protein RadC
MMDTDAIQRVANARGGVRSVAVAANLDETPRSPEADIVLRGSAGRLLPGVDRPREKLGRLGTSPLGDNELLAVVLGGGTRRTSALGVADALLDSAGGLHGLLRFTRDELQRIPGVGTARAAQVLAALELGRRTLARGPTDRPAMRSPADIAAHLLPEYGGRPVEHFGIVLLDTKRRVLRTTVLSIGTLDRSVVHPRDVFREAASGHASGIVLFHNHPSGDPSPSGDDLTLTRRLVDAGELMGIEVLDHLVLTATRYCSLREIGRIG